MKKCKNVFGTIFGFTIGTIIASITATYAATTLSSKNVYYDNSNSGGSSTNVAGAIDELYATADDQDILKKEIIDTIYPVGSVYITTTESQVSDVVARFGGTWERYATDTTLVGYKEGTNTINATGGSKTVTLSNSNLPKHTHTTPESSLINGSAVVAGAHEHKLYLYTSTTNVGEFVATSEAYGSLNVSVTKPNTSWNVYRTTHNSTGGVAASVAGHTHDVTGTIPAMTTNSCTNCSSAPVNVQDPYTVVYMYKRTA